MVMSTLKLTLNLLIITTEINVDFKYLSYRSEIGAVSADSYKYKAGKLLEGSDYCFRVAAENSVGTGAFATTESITAKLPFGKALLFFTWHYVHLIS